MSLLDVIKKYEAKFPAGDENINVLYSGHNGQGRPYWEMVTDFNPFLWKFGVAFQTDRYISVGAELTFGPWNICVMKFRSEDAS